MAEARSVSVCFTIVSEGNLQYATCIIFPRVVMLQYFVPLSQVPLTLTGHQSYHKSFLNFMWPHFFLGFFFPLSVPVSLLYFSSQSKYVWLLLSEAWLMHSPSLPTQWAQCSESSLKPASCETSFSTEGTQSLGFHWVWAPRPHFDV